MEIEVQFFSYCKELTGCDHTKVTVEPGATLGALQALLIDAHPRLQAMRKSLLIAVGVEYQTSEYVLQEGDEVSLFPPVQGG